MVKGKNLWPPGLFFTGLIFTCAGLAVVYYLGKDINFSCSRAADRCLIQKTNVFGDIEAFEEIELRKLAGAEVIETRDSDGDYIYKVVLITNRGRVPLSNMSSSECRSYRKTADKINNYVASDEERLDIEHSGSFMKIIGFVFAGLGGLMLLGSFAGLFKPGLLLFAMPAGKK